MARANRRHWEPEEDTFRFLNAVLDVLHGDELADMWPVTLRGVHYAMLGVDIGSGVYENTPKQYKKLGVLLAKARISRRIPWDAIADNHREHTTNGGGFENAEAFISYSRRDFLTGYTRDILADQPRILEVWVEKDTVARYVNDVASEYNIDTVVARGYGSVSFVNALRNRVLEARNEDKTMRLLYFGDLDPSGVNMLDAMFTTLHEEMGVDTDDIDHVRCAITPQQVTRFKLAPNPDALKDDAWQRRQRQKDKKNTKQKGDPRAEAYKAEYGKVAVELDALGPKRLQTLVRKAIEDNLDMDLYNAAREQEEADIARIDKLRERLESTIDAELE